MTCEPRIRVLVVDDEPLARERVLRFLASDDGVEVVGACPDGFSAVEAVLATRPDLLFLDVQMPGKDGFEVLDEVGALVRAVIFLTAYDRYAVRAFDACAVDYLLKPFDEERFARAIARAKAALASPPPVEPTLPPRAHPVPTDGGYLRRLLVKTGDRLVFVKTDDVSWVEASGNYALLHSGRGSFLVRESLLGLEARLDPEKFLRIHRSTLVNVDRVGELQPLFHGQYRVVLDDGTHLIMSRRFRGVLDRFLRGDV
jgi:two-component system, LytTR family, response regulator